jgi:hypothetical protein
MKPTVRGLLNEGDAKGRGAAMKRLTHIVGVFLLVTVASPRSARADIWDWLQEFSGPGPFHARGPNLMFDVCPQTTTSREAASLPFLRDFEVSTEDAQRQERGGQHVKCFFADFRFFQNRNDDNFGVDNVKLNVFEVGASARLHRAISIGFGAGAMQISTPDHSSWKGVFTGPRVIVKPLLLFGSNDFWANHEKVHLVLGSVKYYMKENIVLGHLRGKDFGLAEGAPNYSFDFTNDRVASTGFIIDATDLIVVTLRRLSR